MDIAQLFGWVSEIEGIHQLLNWLIYLNALVVTLILISEERDPSTTLAWTFALVLFPGVGLVFYFLFGRNWRALGRRDRVRAEAGRIGLATLTPVYDRWARGASKQLESAPAFARRLSVAVTAQNSTRPLPCSGLEVFATGEEKFARLIADIEAARDSVHLQYFIWESDELTARICALLASKVRQGVEVRVMYDWVGSLPYRKDQLKQLSSEGAEVRADAARWTRLNFRNHRKIVVIDGRIAYTGGMNLGQEYIDGKPRYDSWRDTHVRFGGPLVADLQRLFCERWFRITGEVLFTERHFPELPLDEGTERVVWGQLAHSGPESRWPALRNAYLLAILSAEKRVRVQSPYFVPDEAILEALVTQSLAGVEVELMMTGVPDKRIAWNAAFSYIDELVHAGGRVYQYEAGFFHPKAMTIDGALAAIGTMNFDIRSFMLHDELSVFFFEQGVAAEQDAIFEADLAFCREILEADYEQLGKLRRFRNALARLSSRLL